MTCNTKKNGRAKLMRKQFFIAVTIILGLCSGSAVAEQSNWIGADAMVWNYDPDNAPKASSTGARIRGGIEYTKHFGVETHLASGGDDTITVNDVDVNVSFDLLWGVFLRGNYPLGNTNLYGLFGFSNLNMSIDSSEVSGADRVTRISYGAGAEYLINKNWGINADYIVYLKSDTFDFHGGSLGVRYRF